MKVWYGTPQGRFVLDTIVLKLPVLGLLIERLPWRGLRDLAR